MRGLGYVCLFVAVATWAGCDDEPETQAAPVVEEQVAEAREDIEEAREAAREAAEGAGRRDIDACTILTEAVVRSALELPADVAVEKVPSSGYSAWPLCSYRWPNPDYDPQANARAMMERMRKRFQKGARSADETAETLLDEGLAARASFEVSYTHGPAYDDDAAASRAFQGQMAAAERGASRTIDRGPQKGQEVSINFEMEPVEGFASEAQWNERWNQLSVRAGTQIFHVRAAIDQSSEANLEHAKKLARAIIDAS